MFLTYFDINFIKSNVYRYKVQGFKTTYPNMFPFGFSSVISKVSVADFQLVLICSKRYSPKTIVVLFPKYLAQQTNTYSKSVAQTLKQAVKSVKS